MSVARGSGTHPRGLTTGCFGKPPTRGSARFQREVEARRVEGTTAPGTRWPWRLLVSEVPTGVRGFEAITR